MNYVKQHFSYLLLKMVDKNQSLKGQVISCWVLQEK